MKMKRRDLLKGMAGGLALAALEGPQIARASSGHELSPDAVGILYDLTLCVGVWFSIMIGLTASPSTT